MTENPAAGMMVGGNVDEGSRMAAVQPGKIRMVAGLGNPGEEYAQTRHNAGFCSVDALARQAGVSYWKNQLGAEVAVINVADAEAEGGRREVVLVKPQSLLTRAAGPSPSSAVSMASPPTRCSSSTTSWTSPRVTCV